MSMQINISYQGALAARNVGRLAKTDLTQLAGQKIEGELNGKAFSLTISNELIQLNNEMDELFAYDYNIQKADPNDIFSYKPQDQWLIFSQYLHDQNLFDNMTDDEVIELETMLKQITDGLDSLTSTGINLFGGINRQLDSYEAQLELGSSTAALQLFSERFLTDDIKSGFDSLIKDYVKHNEAKVKGYKSIEERFYQARAKIIAPNTSLSSEQAKTLNITNQLGKSQLDESSLSNLLKRYTDLFSNLKDKSNISSTIEEIRKITIESITQNVRQPDKKDAGEWVNNRIADTLDRVASYFSMLLE